MDVSAKLWALAPMSATFLGAEAYRTSSGKGLGFSCKIRMFERADPTYLFPTQDLTPNDVQGCSGQGCGSREVLGFGVPGASRLQQRRQDSEELPCTLSRDTDLGEKPGEHTMADT